MRHLLFSTACVIAISAFSTHGNGASQENRVDDGWVRINICHISFFAPPDMKQSDQHGIDSCAAVFANGKMAIYLDYGQWGGPHQQCSSTDSGFSISAACSADLEFKKVFITIDGKNAEVATYINDTNVNSGPKYIASLYVELKKSESERFPRTISLVMSIAGNSTKDQETAQRIFRTIHFE